MSEGWKERRRGIIIGFLHNKLKLAKGTEETHVYPSSVTLTCEAFRGRGVSLGKYNVVSDGVTPMVDLIANTLPGHGYPASNDNWQLFNSALATKVRAAPSKPLPAPRTPKRRVAPPATKPRPRIRQPEPGTRDAKVLASAQQPKGPSCPTHQDQMALDTERNVWRCVRPGCKKVAFPKSEEPGDSWKHSLKVITGELTLVIDGQKVYLRTQLNHLIDITSYLDQMPNRIQTQAGIYMTLPYLDTAVIGELEGNGRQNVK